MLSALLNGTFRLLWAGGAVSGMGSWLLVVATPVYVFTLSGSPTATGLTLALGALPGLLVGPWAGALLEHRDLPRAMWLADLAAAAAVAVILLVDDAGRLWLIYLAVLLENLAVTVFRPAARALTPTILGTGAELAAANSLTALSGSILRLAAPPLGALILAGPGFTAVLSIDIASYLASATLTAAASRRIPARTPSGRTSSTLNDLRAGFAHIAHGPRLRGPLVGNIVFLTANAGLTALLVPLVVIRLGVPGYSVGYLVSALGIGFIIGAAVSRAILTRLGIRRILIATHIAITTGFIALVNAPDLPAALIAAVLIGIPGSILLVCTEIHVQRTAPSAMLARIGSIFFAADSLAAIIGGLCAPVLARVLGLGPALNATAAIGLGAVIVTWRLDTASEGRDYEDRD